MSEYDPGQVDQKKVIQLRIDALKGSVKDIEARVAQIMQEVGSGITPGRAWDLLSILTSTQASSGEGIQTIGGDIDSQINDLINAVKGMVVDGDPGFGDLKALNGMIEELTSMRRTLQSNIAQATTIADGLSDEGRAWQAQAAAINELLNSGTLQFQPEIWTNMSTYDREAYSRLDPDGANYLNSLAVAPSGSLTQSTTQTTTRQAGTATGGSGAVQTTTQSAAAPKPTRAPFPVVGQLGGKDIYGRDATGMPPSDKTILESMQAPEGYTFVQKSNGLEFIPLGSGPGMGFSYDYLMNADLDALGFTGQLRDSLGDVQAALQEEQAYYDQVMRDRNEQALAYEREASQQYVSDLRRELGAAGWWGTNDMNIGQMEQMLGQLKAKQAEEERQAALDQRYPNNAPIVSNP